MHSSTQRFLVNATWLIKLRWVAVVGQVLTITGAWLAFNIPLYWWPLAVVIGLTAASNVVLTFWVANRFCAGGVPADLLPWHQTQILSLVMTMDMLSLTTLLYVTGGPNNPFLLFFFVNISLAAVLVGSPWAWALQGLGVACFVWLLVDHVPVAPLSVGLSLAPIAKTGVMSLQQFGMLVAFITCSGVIVYFATRLGSELREHETNLRLAQEQTARSEKLEALGTLAAGAAHELATPLSTIAVVARDVEASIEREADNDPGKRELQEDVRLIRTQLDRCRSILDQMSRDAGQAIGEGWQHVPLQRLQREVQRGLSDGARVQWDVSPAAANTTVTLPLAGLAQAIRGLVQNAIDAHGPHLPVEVELGADTQTWFCRVRDRGPGMPQDVLRRVSEPFFTTKPPGKGLGLGLFLARNIVERLGGTLDIASAPDRGTTVTLRLPFAPASVLGKLQL